MDNKQLYKNQKVKQDFKVDWKQDTKGDFKVDFKVFAAPLAAFVADKTTGAHPLAVQFTNQSTGDVNTYLWDFGDSTSATTASPLHSYAAAGTYTVKLTVTGPLGNNLGTRTGYIVVS